MKEYWFKLCACCLHYALINILILINSIGRWTREKELADINVPNQSPPQFKINRIEHFYNKLRNNKIFIDRSFINILLSTFRQEGAIQSILNMKYIYLQFLKLVTTDTITTGIAFNCKVSNGNNQKSVHLICLVRCLVHS